MVYTGGFRGEAISVYLYVRMVYFLLRRRPLRHSRIDVRLITLHHSLSPLVLNARLNNTRPDSYNLSFATACQSYIPA